MEKYNVKWFCNPSSVKHIIWEDIEQPCEETVNFEPDGDGNSKYLYAYRKKDNRFMKVAKVIKNFAFLPIFALTEVLGILTILYHYFNSNATVTSLYCLYAMLFLLGVHFICQRSTSERMTT